MQTFFKIIPGVVGTIMICLSFTRFVDDDITGPVLFGIGVILLGITIVLLVRLKVLAAGLTVGVVTFTMAIVVLASLGTVPVIKAEIVLESGKKIHCYTVELIDACSEWGKPVEHKINFPEKIAKTKKIVFLGAGKQTGARLFEVTNQSNQVTQVETACYTYSMEGRHIPGIGVSHYERGTSNKYSHSSYEDSWVDFIRYRKWYGEGWVEMDRVSAINFSIQ